MHLKQHIPNAITCGNLVSGCLSILFLTHNMPVKAAIMIFVAGLFDFLDGFAARLLHAHSPIVRCGLFRSGTGIHHVLADEPLIRFAAMVHRGHQCVTLLGISVASVFGHPFG